MTDGDDLYRAILAHPDDDAPRLVWADWLDERGQPDRAAFVRLQCEWARLDPGDPRQDLLWERWAGLLDRNRDRWAAGLGPAARNSGFWRGLPDWFDVSTATLTDQLDRLRRSVPAQCLNLYLTGFREELRKWPGLEAVRYLDVREGAADPFYPHSSVRGWVWLLQSPRLAGLRGLEVDLDVTSAGVLAALAGADWPHLRELGLRVQNTEPGRPPAVWADLAGAPWLPGLKALDLWGCGLGDTGAARVAAGGRRALTRLGLGMNDLTPAGLRALARSDALPGLLSLELSGNPVAEAVGDLLQSPTPSGLCSLTASNVVGRPGDGDRLAWGVAGSPPGRLRMLELNSNNFRLPAVRTLLMSPALAGLEVLSLNGNELTDGAASAVAASPYLTRLRRLDLAGNRLTDDGLAVLGGADTLPALRVLNVRHNDLSADGLIDFEAAPLARRLWRLETDYTDPPRKRYGYEALG